MSTVTRILRALPLALLAPLLTIASGLALFITDLVFALRRPRRPPHNRRPSLKGASVVIPSWNARDLLEKYLPTVVEALLHGQENEVIVVDNASTDGSAEFIRQTFPEVRVLQLPQNLGFGGGSNAGFQAAKNDIVVLLNNDMRVEPDFLAPLLEGFTDDDVFSVSCQIFFGDPNKKREETGLTETWWAQGALRVRHRLDDKVTRLFPCSYGGGGSCAYDRHKFLELGGFDPLLAPFYLEDTDVGYMAWKRGWRVLYEPRSRVYHEHRGTIGKRFTPEQIQEVLHKNFILFSWKNIHEGWRLISHLFYTLAAALFSAFFGLSPERPTLTAIWRTFLQLPQAMRSRWQARTLAVVSDTEAFRRPFGGYYRDRFHAIPQKPDRLQILFVSPYPICPPIHGGGVFMLETCRQLAKLCHLHLVVLLDHPHELAAHKELADACASAEFLVRIGGQPRKLGSLVPHAITEFQNADLHWLIQRQIHLHKIDVVQLEYLPMGQYTGSYRRLASALFEHDIYFQSIGRALPGLEALAAKTKATFEYMRALRYELKLLPQFDIVQVCSPENAQYLTGFLPALRERLDDGNRAAIDTSRYPFITGGREPDTMLFLGSFRHQPNLRALSWFAKEILPLIRAAQPNARLVVVGSDPPPRHFLPACDNAIEFRGFVEDVRDALARYAVFVCPILNGSGVRVKLLEAFSSGIPVVSTRLGAEGLARKDGEICALADDPQSFAGKVLELLANPAKASAMASRARNDVTAERDVTVLTKRLVERYTVVVEAKRRTFGQGISR